MAQSDTPRRDATLIGQTRDEGYAAAERDIAAYVRVHAKLNRHELGIIAQKWHRRLVAIAENLESGAWNGETAQLTEAAKLVHEEILPIDFSAQCPILPNVEGISPTNS